MVKPALTIAICLFGAAIAQQKSKSTDSTQQKQPPMKVNVLNVCTPSSDEQAVLKDALAKAKAATPLATDFEIARGRATLKDAPPSKYVRLRRDVGPQSPWETAQYSMSRDPQSTVETLVLRLRDPKEFHELSIEDRVSSEAASAVTVLSSDTPASRIRVERLGKSSVALARCPNADQSAYESIFSEASDVMTKYRKELGLRTEFREDISWLDGGTSHKAARTSTTKSSKK